MSGASPGGGAIILGAGAVAEAHAAYYGRGIAPPDGVSEETRPRLSAVVDSDEGRARAFARRHDVRLVFTDMEEALAEVRPEVVHICTPPWLHAEQSIAAMRAGAWVLCEKPACGSLAELDRIEAVERATGCYAATVFQWRFGSGMRHLKRRVEAGALGRPLVAVCNTLWYRDAAYYAVPWRGRWATELGGPTMIHGIHLVDALLWLLGDWEEICARAPTLARDLETEDVSAAVVRFAGGALATVLNSVLSPRQETYLRIDFERATVEASGLYEVTNAQWRATALPADESEERSRLEAAWGTIGEEAPATQATQIAELYRDLRAGRPPLTTGRERRRTMEFITGLYKSAFTGTVVTPASITSDDPYYRRLSPAAPPTPATAPPSFGSKSPPGRNQA
ncbi:MAG: Gfo/Idh/MocA family protein [Spirochaetota bacterium]